VFNGGSDEFIEPVVEHEVASFDESGCNFICGDDEECNIFFLEEPFCGEGGSYIDSDVVTCIFFGSVFVDVVFFGYFL